MKSINLFLGNVGGGEIMLLLFTLGFFLLLFLALRALLLWYWKVNIIIENQEKQIHLLSKLAQEVKSSYTDPATIEEKARRYDERTRQS